ncbi:protein PAXX [Strix aluco]|uniref:protein PAXX n=1 Tax=Strix aluco TaxID=111821 RepID=UPI003DA31143
MAEPAGPFHLLRAGPGRYLCYCLPGPGPGGTPTRWRSGPRSSAPARRSAAAASPRSTARSSGGCRGRGDPAPGPRVALSRPRPRREALGRGAAALSLAGAPATLQLREEAARCSALDLVKLPGGEARSQLQGLVFGMARRIESLEERLEAAETLASSCSPEKNTARSQQLFLPGRQLPGDTSPGLAACLPSLPQEPAGPVSTCSSGHPESPRLCGCCQLSRCSGAFLVQKGPGLSTVALGVSGVHCAQVGCQAWPGRLLTSLQEVRLRCSSRLGAMAGPWLPAVLGEETRLGPSSPATDGGPAGLGCWGLTLGMEGLAGLPEQLADLL